MSARLQLHSANWRLKFTSGVRFICMAAGSGELVVGITLNGNAKAYPLELLRQKKVLTETLKGTALSVTYAPDIG